MAARLTVLAGPTAVGKGPLAAWVREHHPEVWLSISATTRAPRPGEIDGVHYFFVSEDRFTELVESGEMLEWAVVHGRHRYGTPARPVFHAVEVGLPVILEIDLAGARQVRQRVPEASFVFLAPPTWEALVRRLVGRGTENAAQRERRLATARTELAAASEFDHVVVNDQVGKTVDQLVDLLGLCTPTGEGQS